MHIQRGRSYNLRARAHAADKATVSAAHGVIGAEKTPDIDYLHIGELGDATDRVIECLDLSNAVPPHQLRFATAGRLAMADFPLPAYHVIALGQILAGNAAILVRLSLSLRVLPTYLIYMGDSRVKSSAQLLGELDFILSQGEGFIPQASISSMTTSSATVRPPRKLFLAFHRLATKERLSVLLFLRGDAQHRQTDPTSWK